MLETICFNFTSRMPFPYVIKICRGLRGMRQTVGIKSFPTHTRRIVSKQMSKLSWRLAIDSFRTQVNLMFPPHVVALACIYLAALLISFEQDTLEIAVEGNCRNAQEITMLFCARGEWERHYKAHLEDLHGTYHFPTCPTVTTESNSHRDRPFHHRPPHTGRAKPSSNNIAKHAGIATPYA